MLGSRSLKSENMQLNDYPIIEKLRNFAYVLVFTYATMEYGSYYTATSGLTPLGTV